MHLSRFLLTFASDSLLYVTISIIIMKLLNVALAIALSATACQSGSHTDDTSPMAEKFVTVSGTDLIKPDGEKLFIRGTNLSNWLNPEGYMFGFRKANSARMINEVICEMVGPAETANFWKEFKENYITRADIKYIASTGANTVRMPFHYKLFTDEDYMGLTTAQDGFARVDSVVAWCRDNDLYVILDMHDAPGGQTGDNIDDSYGYPWIFESEPDQALLCKIWRSIAERYKDEPVILGYEIMNEPIPHYMENKKELNALLEPLYKRAVASIREVDNNHIILLGGSQWNSDFSPFSDWKFDDKIMYTCHRYGGDASAEAISSFIAFRDSTGLPMYMGEIGHNTDQWQHSFSEAMEANNIGYTFWPYKKLGESCMVGINAPEGWDMIVEFSEAPRSTFAEIQAARPDRAKAKRLLGEFIKASRLENCTPQTSYIESMKLTPQPIEKPEASATELY